MEFLCRVSIFILSDMKQFIPLCLLLDIVIGWGGEGHRIVSSVATMVMSKPTRLFLEKIIGGHEDLARASVWADTREAEVKYPRSGALHFSNTPYRKCSGFDFDRDCGVGSFKGICIVTGLAEAISRAIDPHVSDTVRSDSLKFILHLMADIHQPLHTGFRADSGGVRIGLGKPSNTSLHYIWDNWMIDEMRRHNSEPVEMILRHQLEKNSGRFVTTLRSKMNITDILSCEANIVAFVAALASETSTTVTCNSGYKGADGQWIGVGAVIDESFYTARQAILTVQLLKASVRLGILMEGIHDKIAAQKKSQKERRRIELFSGMTSLPIDSREGGSSNYFGELYVEFDPESLEQSTVTDEVVTRIPERTSSRVENPFNETEAVELAIRESEAEKLSYTFSGVDLSQVRLHAYKGRHIVTNKLLKEYISIPMDMRYFPVQTASKKGDITTTLFEFDGTYFTKELSEDIIIRIVLKISGIDPRIDITDYLETIKPHMRIDDAISSSIIELLAPRTMKRIDRKVQDRETILKRISDMASKILWKSLDDNSVGVVHRDTLAAWSSTERSPTIRFTKIPYISTSDMSRPQFAFVDPRLLNQPFHITDGLAIVRTMNEYPRYNPSNSLKTYEHVIWKELAEISKEIQYQWWKIGGRKERQYIQWVFEYEVNGDIPGDYRMNIVEAVRKGFFNTTDELISYIS